MAQFPPSELPQIDEKDPSVQEVGLGVPRVMTSNCDETAGGMERGPTDPIHTKSAYATFDETYRFEKGTLYAERRVNTQSGEVAEHVGELEASRSRKNEALTILPCCVWNRRQSPSTLSIGRVAGW